MIVVAGPPGSGKSALFPVHGFETDYFNADDRSAQLNGGSGGHSAPAEQLQRIHQASLGNLPRAIHEVDEFDVYDNTTPGGPTQLVLSARNGVVTFRKSPCPEWLKGALDQTEHDVVEE